MHALPLALILCVLSGCASRRSYAELSADVEAVPVPGGVTFVRQKQEVFNGAEFTDTKYKQVIRQYRANVPCAFLEDNWAEALRSAGRRFHITNYPHKYGAIGSLEIQIDDRPETVGINLGTDDGYCANPFVYSFNLPR